MNKVVRPQMRKPQRSCAACKTSANKQQMLRFVRVKSGEVVFDDTGKLAGRGAYLCDEQTCFDKTRKGRIFDRALRTKLDDKDYERLLDECRRYGYFDGQNNFDKQNQGKQELGRV